MQRLSSFIKSVETGKAALFIGAGFSAIAGCSNLKTICDKIKELNIVKAKIENQGAGTVTPRELIAFCKKKLTSEDDIHEFDGIMRNGLAPEPIKYAHKYMPFIEKLKYLHPLPPVLTTNVDNCLTNSRVFNMSKIYRKVSDMKINYFMEGSVFHLHGNIEDVNDQVWDLYEYSRRYGEQKFQEFIIKVFQEYSVLFMGYSFGDTELLQQVAKAASEISTREFTHFALLPQDDFPNHVNAAVYKELYNIEVIKYGPKEDFADIIGRWIETSFNISQVGQINQERFIQ